MKRSKEKTRIYLDYASGHEPNPSSIHMDGALSRAHLEDARTRIAACIGAHADEIVFTSGGTEANNLAVFGTLRDGDEAVTSAFEHKSILTSFEALEKDGDVKVRYISPADDGIVRPQTIACAVNDRTRFVSLMLVNNEIGTIQPVREMVKLVRKNKPKGICFHTDACQALSYLDVTVENLGVDLMTFNAHKIGGPRGVGVLYVKRGTPLKPLIYGGGQERGLRAGTEDVSAIVEFADVFEMVVKTRARERARVTLLRDGFIRDVLARIPNAYVNGSPTERIANNANFSFLGVDGEELVLRLDAQGVSVSSGSACGASLSSASYVILSLGKGREYAESAVRFTLGPLSKRADLEMVVGVLEKTVASMRETRRKYVNYEL